MLSLGIRGEWEVEQGGMWEDGGTVGVCKTVCIWRRSPAFPVVQLYGMD